MRFGATLSLAAAGLVALAAGCSSTTRATPEITTGDVAEAVLTGTHHYKATGKPPVYQVMPGDPVFAQQARTTPSGPESQLFTNNVRPANGEIVVEAIDRVSGDKAIERQGTTKEGDEANVKGWFQTEDGRYDFTVNRVAATPNEFPLGEKTVFGGVATDVLLNGDTGIGTPLEPKVKAGVAIWGFARIEKNGQVIAENAPVKVLVTSRTRDEKTGKYLGAYDASKNKIDEVHLIILPSSLQAQAPQAAQPLPAGQPKPQAGEQGGMPEGRQDRNLPEERAGGLEQQGMPQQAVPQQGMTGLEKGFHIVWEHADVALL